MRRWHATLVALLVAVVIHLDWHLARPAHHRLSLAWRQHWIVAAAAFAGIGWLVARRWPDQPWRTASGVVVAGVFVGQGLEPVVEYWLAHGQLGYSGETARRRSLPRPRCRWNPGSDTWWCSGAWRARASLAS